MPRAKVLNLKHSVPKPFVINQIATAIGLLVSFIAAGDALADCDAVAPVVSSQDVQEGTSSDASPAANTVLDTEVPSAQTMIDPSGSFTNGDSGDGGSTMGTPGGLDYSGADTLSTDAVAAAVAATVIGTTFPVTNADLVTAANLGVGTAADFGINVGGGEEQLWHHMADPIDVATADKVHVQVDYVSLGQNPIRMARSYHSNSAQNPANVTVPMGTGWHMFYDRTLQQVSSSQIKLHRANGSVLSFTYNGTAWVSPGSTGLLIAVSGGWSYYNLRNTIETYNSAGRLIGMSDGGLVTQLTYDGSNRLSRVQNAFGRALTFGYDGSGRVSTIGLPDSTHLSYAYDGYNNLISITFSDNTVRQYAYENSSFHNALTGITDESGRRRLTWSYDSAGRPSGSYFGSNQNASTISYSGSQVTTTDARGTQRTRSIASVNGKNVVSGLQTAATQNSSATAWSFGFDASGNMQSAITRTGETHQFSRDARGRVTSQTRAAGTSLANTISTTWHPTFNMPTQTVINGVTTNYAVDSAGRITGVTQTSGSSTITSLALTYNSQGLIQSKTDSRGTVFNYAYDASGNLTSVTNQTLNQTTNYSNYNANGQPQTIQRSDGVTVTRAFDSRGRMISRSTPDGTTTFTYDGSGRLLKTTLPDGSYTVRSYDSAGLFTSVSNNRSETTNIVRDVAAAVVGTNTYSAAGALTGQTRSTIDAVGRRSAIVDSRGYSTKLLYGTDGRPTGATDPLGYNTGVQLDVLNRPSVVTQPNTTAMRNAGGAATTSAQYAYSAYKLSNISDNTSVATAYSYDGFNRRLSEGGNDPGASGVVLNSAGDVVSHTDPLGTTIGATHDALGRLTSTTYGGSADRTYTYVSGHSDSLLANVTDSNAGSIAWTYDSAGRLLTQQQTVYGLQESLKVTRDTLGRPATITYPSGVVLGINYSADVVSSLTLNGSTLLNSIAYLPQSATPTNWKWGNGTGYSRSFDADGRVTSVTLGSVQRSYKYDANGRITSETDTGASGTKQYAFGYDELGHVISYSSPTLSQTYTYDGNGNRRSQAGALDNSTFSYVANTNHVSSAAEDTYQYNADGTPTTALTSVQYDIYRRVSQISTVATKWVTGYNALGQRDLMLIYHYVNCSPGGGNPMVSKAPNQTVTADTCTNWQLISVRRYMYDDQGRLLGEYDSSLGTSQETIWFNNQPVATVTNGVIYYINADNIGAPRSIVRASDNTELWRWDSDPFGSTAPTAPNPTAGTISFNLRLPGQVAGSAYYYNGARDYNSATGRYLEPDPTGLGGGLNRYGYASGNPLSLTDPLGLQSLTTGGLVGYANYSGANRSPFSPLTSNGTGQQFFPSGSVLLGNALAFFGLGGAAAGAVGTPVAMSTYLGAEAAEQATFSLGPAGVAMAAGGGFTDAAMLGILGAGAVGVVAGGVVAGSSAAYQLLTAPPGYNQYGVCKAP